MCRIPTWSFFKLSVFLSIFLFFKYLSMKITLQWVQNSIFLNRKFIFPILFSWTNSRKLITSFMMFIYFEVCPALFDVNYQPYFQQWNSNWEIAFLNSPLDRFELGFLNVGLGLYFELFPNSQKDWKLGFLNVAVVGLLHFCQFMKDMENWDFCLLA